MKLFERKKRTPAQTFRLTLVNAVVLIALELVLKHWMGANDVVSVLFAAGATAPYWKVSLALCFVLIRLIVWLILPGILAREVFLLLIPQRDSAR